MTILDDIVAYKKAEVAAAKANTPLWSIERLAEDAGPTRGFERALANKAAKNFALIAEIKKASPSKGLIRESFAPAEHAAAYERGGATCLSVLTDGPSFQGTAEHLKAARSASTLPVLRKDFMIDPYQVVGARAWGADCILLIMACLDDDQAAELAGVARDLTLDVLVETHDGAEMERAASLGATLIGVNNRNLNTFETSLSVTADLAAKAPAGALLVSESGIARHDDLVTLKGCGAKAFLVGESLMRCQDIAIATSALLNGSVSA